MISKLLTIAAMLLFSTAHASGLVYTPTAVAAAHALAGNEHGGVGRIADTGSMEPTLTHRDMVVFVPGLNPKVGDIVVFHSLGTIVCHRIVDTDGGDWRVTQGDHNKARDPAIGVGQIMGVVLYAVDGQTGAVRSMR